MLNVGGVVEGASGKGEARMVLLEPIRACEAFSDDGDREIRCVCWYSRTSMVEK